MTRRPFGNERGSLVRLVLLLAGGATLIAALGHARLPTPLRSSLATPFQLLGTPMKLMDRLASRMLPVGSVEERDLGDTYRRRYEAMIDPDDRDQAYLDALMERIRTHARKPFPYRAYRIGRVGAAQAMALPGGVILVSDELLHTLGSEAELVSVLAHEAGHIELGHCFDLVRFELLTRRSGRVALGELADLAAQLLLRQPYSKSVEHEADEYAFALLRESAYDPGALGDSFASLRTAGGGMERRTDAGANADPLRDYLSSHPPLVLREAEFSERARAWWHAHPTARRYVGKQNLQRRQPLDVVELAEEWRMGAADQATR